MKFSPLFHLAISCVLVGSGCLKPPSQTLDHGPEVPASEVQLAILDAWGSADPATIGAREFESLEQDQKISTLDPRVVYKEATEVCSREVKGDEITYNLLLRSTSINETGSFKPETSIIQELVVKNPSITQNLLSAAREPAFPNSIEALQKSMASGRGGLFQNDNNGKVQENSLGLQTVLSMFDACVKSKNWDVTCHNLKVSHGWTLPPIGVSSRPDCGGIPNCQISFKRISFDLVVNLPSSDGKSTHEEKVIYDFTISQDVPYLSRLTDFCYQGLVVASGQRILVKICNRVQNFIKELPPIPPKEDRPELGCNL